MNPQQTNIPLTAFQDFVCGSEFSGFHKGTCSSLEFTNVVRVKTYKGLLSGGKRIIASIQVFKCVTCGAIHDLNAMP